MTNNFSSTEYGSEELDRLKAAVSRVARKKGYSAAEIRAGIEHFCRSTRISNPPGQFDNAGRFTPAEKSAAVAAVRAPSRAYPYSEMNAARTARHCAEVFGAESEIAVKRVARAMKECRTLPATTNPEKAAIAEIAVPIMKSIRCPAGSPAAT